ncbi:MAG: hypothetical protein LUC41_06485 [Clostridiales bacterium]|nr:hypothetical protein [Clostridiales bacterium]
MKSLQKLVRYDLKAGILRNWVFLLVPICALLVIRQCRMTLWTYDTEGTWAVYVMYLFRGMQAVSRNTVGNRIQIPVLWGLIMILPLFITLQYPFRDMTGYGTQLLLRSGKRRTWWLSKCGWDLISTVIYFLLLYATTAVYCLIRGLPVTLDAPWQPMLCIFMDADIMITGDQVLTAGQTAFFLLLLPFLTVAALDLLEMFLSLITRPVYGLLICVAIVAASMFSSSPILFTNYGDLTRCGAFIYGGLKGYVGVVICLVIMIGSVIGGTVLFHRRDILPASKEF